MSRQLTLLLGNRKPSGELAYSVDKLYTYRYVGANRAWDTVYNWRYSHGFSVTENIFGVGDDNRYNSMLIVVPALAFTGKVKQMTIAFSSIYVASDANRTFRWAVAPEGNKANYQGGSEVLDGNGQIAHGTFTLDYIGQRYSAQSFTVEVPYPANTPLGIYITAANSSYGNCHVGGTVSVELS